MARYFHLTTIDNENIFTVADGWFPEIVDGRLVVTEKDGTTGSFPLADVVRSRFETRRSTPARDAKVQAIETALLERAQAQACLGIPVGTLDPELERYVDAVVAYTKAQDALSDHDLALSKAKAAAAENRKNPKAKVPTKAKKAPKK